MLGLSRHGADYLRGVLTSNSERSVNYETDNYFNFTLSAVTRPVY